MRGRDKRRWHLFDSMILIATLPLAFVAAQAYLRTTTLNRRPSQGWAWLNTANNGGVPFATICSMGLLVSRIREPYAERRRLCTQPGFTAALAIFVCVTLALLDYGSKTIFFRVNSGAWRLSDHTRVFVDLMDAVMRTAPRAVAATWAVLAVGGRWRPERSWHDRLGTLLGIYWICWPEIAWLVALTV